eukprot:221572-Pelagomonas_calceolata.AAC.1
MKLLERKGFAGVTVVFMPYHKRCNYGMPTLGGLSKENPKRKEKRKLRRQINTARMTTRPESGMGEFATIKLWDDMWVVQGRDEKGRKCVEWEGYNNQALGRQGGKGRNCKGWMRSDVDVPMQLYA